MDGQAQEQQQQQWLQLQQDGEGAVAAMVACADEVRIAGAGASVFKDECCLCFNTPKFPGGILVDLASLVAYCPRCVEWNVAKTGHSLFLRVAATTAVEAGSASDAVAAAADAEMVDAAAEAAAEAAAGEERPLKKPTRLGIGVEGGFQVASAADEEAKWATRYSIVVLPSGAEVPFAGATDALAAGVPDKVVRAVQAVVEAEGAARRQQVEQWVATKSVAKCALTLKQLHNGVTVPATGWKCSRCDLTSNLWLNLTDGTILCGRRNWDGTGGNGHALEYYLETKYPLAVKLGTITRDLENADVFSYEEDDSVEDPLLAQHLKHFGIDFSAMRKTEQTTAEREVDQNLNFEWNRVEERGTELQPLYRPGFTGLKNLGNSCYLASVMQVLFSTTPFASAFVKRVSLHEALKGAPHNPATDFTTQMVKLGHGLLSGDYSKAPPPTASSTPAIDGTSGVAAGSAVTPAADVSRTEEQRLVAALVADGIPPQMFKAVVGKNHPEFSSSRQQDAFEFYQYVFDLVNQAYASTAPSSALAPHHQAAAAVGAQTQGDGVGGGGGGGGDGGGSGSGHSNPCRAFEFEVEEKIRCGASGRVSLKRREDNVLSLPIPLEAATNLAQVAAWEARQKSVQQATNNGPSKKLEEEEAVRPRVPLSACVQAWAQADEIQGFYSSAIKGTTTAHKLTRFLTFPDYLVLHMRKYVVDPGSWTPRKLDVVLDVPDTIHIDHLRTPGGLQPGEELLPDEPAPSQQQQQPQVAAAGAAAPPDASAAAQRPSADPGIVAMLESMGFARERCEAGAISTHNSGVEEAASWVIAHMDDDDAAIAAVLRGEGNGGAAGAAAGAEANVKEDDVNTLVCFGFSATAARNALIATGGNVERAADWILTNPDLAELPPSAQQPQQPASEPAAAAVAAAAAPAAVGSASTDGSSRKTGQPLPDGPGTYELCAFITHLGRNTQCGHYVCHVKMDDGSGRWALFNDAKVAVSEKPPRELAYLYFYRRRHGSSGSSSNDAQ